MVNGLQNLNHFFSGNLGLCRADRMIGPELINQQIGHDLQCRQFLVRPPIPLAGGTQVTLQLVGNGIHTDLDRHLDDL